MFFYKGKQHIRYISKVANKIWADNDFKIPFDICLLEAMRNHRKILKRELEIQYAVDDYSPTNSALNE